MIPRKRSGPVNWRVKKPKKSRPPFPMAVALTLIEVLRGCRFPNSSFAWMATLLPKMIPRKGALIRTGWPMPLDTLYYSQLSTKRNTVERITHFNIPCQPHQFSAMKTYHDVCRGYFRFLKLQPSVFPPLRENNRWIPFRNRPMRRRNGWLSGSYFLFVYLFKFHSSHNGMRERVFTALTSW